MGLLCPQIIRLGNLYAYPRFNINRAASPFGTSRDFPSLFQAAVAHLIPYKSFSQDNSMFLF